MHNADLSAAHLVEANLSNANLCEANLTKAVLVSAFLGGARLINAVANGAEFTHASLFGAQLEAAKLRAANLSNALLCSADLQYADLTQASLFEADLSMANLKGAKLTQANLKGARLVKTNLDRANLDRANLSMATLVETNVDQTIMTGCQVYGISIWDLRGEAKDQSDLVISRDGQPLITVDNVKVGQFVYLLLNNEEIRNVIDTMTAKVVLILGRFTEERRTVLDAIRDELRRRNFVPVLFDFDKPTSKDVTGTVETLARMARFIIADLTNPSSIPHELATIVPFLRSTPVLPLRLVGSE